MDLGGVTFLDCAGVGALVGVRNAAVQAGRQIRVAHAQPIVRRILEVTGLLGVLTAPTDQRSPQRTSRPASRAEDLAVPGVVVNETDVREHHGQERGNRGLPPGVAQHDPVQPAANSATVTAMFVR